MQKHYSKEQVKQILYFNRKKLTESIILSKKLGDMDNACVSHSIKHVTGASDKDIIKATMKLKRLQGKEHGGRTGHEQKRILKNLGYTSKVLKPDTEYGHYPLPKDNLFRAAFFKGDRIKNVAKKYNKGHYLASVDVSGAWDLNDKRWKAGKSGAYFPNYSHTVSIINGKVHDHYGITKPHHRVGVLFQVRKTRQYNRKKLNTEEKRKMRGRKTGKKIESWGWRPQGFAPRPDGGPPKRHKHVGWNRTAPSIFKKTRKTRNDPIVKLHADLEKYHEQKQGRKYKRGLDSVSLPNTYLKGLHAIAHYLHGAAKEAHIYGHPRADNISKLAHHYSRKAEHFENFGMDKKIKKPKTIGETFSNHKAFSQYHQHEGNFYKGLEELTKKTNDKSHFLISAALNRHKTSEKFHTASMLAHWIGLPEASKFTKRAMRESLRTNHFTEKHAVSFNPAIRKGILNDRPAGYFYDKFAHGASRLNRILIDRYNGKI